MSTLTWYQNARLQAIEILSYWQGRINTRDITERFGISRRIAQGDLNAYLSLAPGNLSYSKSERTYLATSIFKPSLTKGSIDEYLMMAVDNGGVVGVGYIEHAQRPNITVQPERFRVLYQAIQNGLGANIHYRSLEHPTGMYREIHPHTLVYSGFRWHVRAYCAVRKDFRDFSLSRIVDIPVLKDETPNTFTAEHDKSWNTNVMIELRANPALSSDERALIETEYEFEKSILSIPTRGALVNYVLHNYQVPTSVSDDNPRRDRLVLSNSDQLKQYLF